MRSTRESFAGRKKIVRIGKKNVTVSNLLFQGLFLVLALAFVIIWLSRRDWSKVRLPNWAIVLIVVAIAIYLLRKYRSRLKLANLAKQYKTDLTIIGLAIFAVIAINLLVYYGTKSKPVIWEWYWSNPNFFWAFNTAWIIVGYLTARRDKDGKIIPTALTVRKFVLGTIFVMVGINLIYHKIPSTNETAFGSSGSYLWHGSPQYANSDNMYQVLAVVADAESGDGTPGSAKQFYPGTDIPVRNPVNAPPGTGAVGKYQINLNDPWVKKAVDDHGWDVEGSEEDNLAAAVFLYKERRLAPWFASRERWKNRIKVIAPFVLAILPIPKDDWSEPAFNPMFGHTLIRWVRSDKSKGKGCEVLLFKGTSREQKLSIFGEHDNLLLDDMRFKCPEEGLSMIITVVPMVEKTT